MTSLVPSLATRLVKDWSRTQPGYEAIVKDLSRNQPGYEASEGIVSYPAWLRGYSEGLVS